jgi:hypothetical protein
VKRHPALIAVLCEHLRANGEFLGHPFFGDLTRHYEKLCNEGEIEQAEALARDLDAGLVHGDDDTDNVIRVSFLENLDHGRAGVEWELLTPGLKEGFDLIHGRARRP